jgi:hypothetical protein
MNPLENKQKIINLVSEIQINSDKYVLPRMAKHIYLSLFGFLTPSLLFFAKKCKLKH